MYETTRAPGSQALLAQTDGAEECLRELKLPARYALVSAGRATITEGVYTKRKQRKVKACLLGGGW